MLVPSTSVIITEDLNDVTDLNIGTALPQGLRRDRME